MALYLTNRFNRVIIDGGQVVYSGDLKDESGLYVNFINYDSDKDYGLLSILYPSWILFDDSPNTEDLRSQIDEASNPVFIFYDLKK